MKEVTGSVNLGSRLVLQLWFCRRNTIPLEFSENSWIATTKFQLSDMILDHLSEPILARFLVGKIL